MHIDGSLQAPEYAFENPEHENLDPTTHQDGGRAFWKREPNLRKFPFWANSTEFPDGPSWCSHEACSILNQEVCWMTGLASRISGLEEWDRQYAAANAGSLRLR